MKTLYLHIGTPKTATSSIQRLLFINRKELHKYSYFYKVLPFSYPNVGLRRNAHFLVGPECFEDQLSEDEKQTFVQRLNAGFSMIYNGFSKYDNVILTDESLWWAFNYTKLDSLQFLIDDAKSKNYSVKIIVYLRRQDLFMISDWKQMIKEGSTSDSVFLREKKVLFRQPLILHYDRALKKLSQKIGKENLIVRRFEPSFWKNQSIYDDFLEALGLDCAQALKQPLREKNPGLKNNFAGIQRRINASRALSDEQKAILRNYVRKASAQREEHPEYGMLSAKETRRFLSRFQTGNDWIAKEYLKSSESLFSPEIMDMKKWHYNNEYMKEDFDFLISSMPEKERDWLMAVK